MYKKDYYNAYKKTKRGSVIMLLANIKTRCYYKGGSKYKYYGGRGIGLCSEWLENPEIFYDWCFKNGYKKGLEIDRIDFNKGYSPDNCRFVTRKENNRNTRKTTTDFINGKRKCRMCGVIKNLKEFRKNKTKAMGYTYECIGCSRKERMEKYYSYQRKKLYPNLYAIANSKTI